MTRMETEFRETKSSRLHLRVTDEQKAEMFLAARASGIDFTTWATETLMQAAGWYCFPFSNEETAELYRRAEEEGSVCFSEWFHEKFTVDESHFKCPEGSEGSQSPKHSELAVPSMEIPSSLSLGIKQPISESIVVAWQKAGARAVWSGLNEKGNLFFHVGREGKEADLPAFRFREWHAGMFGRLPQPQHAFGLLLGDTKVTDDGLKDLLGMMFLQTLALGCTHVTDAGLKELAKLVSLQTLSICYNHVSDAGVKELAGLKSLRVLNLRGTNLTDVGLKALAGLKSPQSLRLGATQITDAGLKEVSRLTSLRMLSLSITSVTDVGLSQLASLTSLQLLDLRGTDVTEAGVVELRKALPGASIRF